MKMKLSSILRLATIHLSIFSSIGFVSQKSVKINVPAPLLAKKMPYKSIDEMIEKIEKPLLLDVFAVWCGPCQMLAQELVALSHSMKGELQVAKMDSDKNPSLASKFRVEGLPTCILFKGGKEIHRFEGFRRAHEMEQEIRNVLNNCN
mmetsp:Transcript_9457/g.14271  ORF Transcript_9457/g.14271 Transcript_9457/m.14271 type:complete len:148 (+) Transcript_9457:48-491(+)